MTIRSVLKRLWVPTVICAACVLYIGALVWLFPLSDTARADTVQRQFVLITDPRHPEISVYCPGSRDDDGLRIAAADASRCTIIAPAPTKPPVFTCRAVEGKGHMPISWECATKDSP